MKKTLFVLLTLTFTLTIFSAANLPLAHSEPMLEMVAIEAKAPGQVKKLARMGIDISEVVKGPLVEGPQSAPILTVLHVGNCFQADSLLKRLLPRAKWPN